AIDAPALPEAQVAWTQWTARLARHAQTAAVAAERGYWEKITALGDAPLADMTQPAGREAQARTRTLLLEAPESAALLGDIHEAYGTQINELLLAAVSRAAARRWPQAKHLRVDVLRAGREHDLGHTDVSGT